MCHRSRGRLGFPGYVRVEVRLYEYRGFAGRHGGCHKSSPGPDPGKPKHFTAQVYFKARLNLHVGLSDTKTEKPRFSIEELRKTL